MKQILNWQTVSSFFRDHLLGIIVLAILTGLASSYLYTWLTREPAPNGYTITNQEPFQGAEVTKFVAEDSLICVTTGPIAIQTTSSQTEFSGGEHGSVVCWIGPQQISATGLSGMTSIKYVAVAKSRAEEVAALLVRSWSEEMKSSKDGCGVDKKCVETDRAIVKPDGFIIRP